VIFDCVLLTYFDRLENGVQELAATDAIEKVSRLMVSETDILAMYACWFVSNMCAASTFTLFRCIPAVPVSVAIFVVGVCSRRCSIDIAPHVYSNTFSLTNPPISFKNLLFLLMVVATVLSVRLTFVWLKRAFRCMKYVLIFDVCLK
jgi:hypothetical protein